MLYFCISDINECASGPCMNNAQCRNEVNQFTCDCAAGWEGATCNQGRDKLTNNKHYLIQNLTQSVFLTDTFFNSMSWALLVIHQIITCKEYNLVTDIYEY